MWVSFLMSATSETDAEKLLPLPTSSRKNSVLASPNPTPLSPASSTIKSPVIEGRAVDETLAGTAATSTTDGEVTPSKSSWLGSFGF